MKKISILVLILVMCLTGCGISIPDISNNTEQNEIVKEDSKEESKNEEKRIIPFIYWGKVRRQEK